MDVPELFESSGTISNPASGIRDFRLARQSFNDGGERCHRRAPRPFPRMPLEVRVDELLAAVQAKQQ